MAASGPVYVRAHFDRRKLAMQFLELLECVVAEQRSSPSTVAELEQRQ